MKRIALMTFIAASYLCLFTAHAFGQTPPAAPVRVVTDTYFDTKIEDPYRYMENIKDPEVVAWMKAQNDYTRATFERIPARAELLARIKSLDNAGVALFSVQRAGGKLFYYKIAPGDDNQKLYVRDGFQGEERLLVNPETLTAGGVHYSIDYFSPSLDGKYVAYGISPGGSEESVLHVIETATGREMGEKIERALFGAINWLPDGRSFYYFRTQKLAPGAPATDKYQKSRIYLHVLGRNPDEDAPVFGYEVSLLVKIAPTDAGFLGYSPASKYVVGIVSQFVRNEMAIYVAPLDSIKGAETPWRKVADFDDDVTGLDVRGDDLYLLSHKGAARYKVLRTSLSNPDLAHASVVVPATDAVIKRVAVARDALYVQLLDGGIGRLLRVPFGGGQGQRVQLPYDGNIQEMVADPREEGVLLKLTSWTEPQLWYAYDPKTGRVTDTKIRPRSPVDFSQIESVEVKVKSYDGTLVPLSIIYKKGLKRDGSHPTLLSGYGAYGVTQDPGFSPTSLAWLERGGILAVAHVRGGGEYGEDWHTAGQKATKMNTWKDFIACAEYLIEQKYTSPSRLAGEGGSAGGITIGRAITERPELFGAAISAVGVSDTLRFETSPNGPPNVPEFGSVSTLEGFKALYEMDSYHHVKAGTKYPAVLLTTGLNDPRVDSWQAAKMTARLQAATASGKPVLLRVDYDAGHGIGSTKSQGDLEQADEWSFLFWQLGVPEFQPKP